MNRRGFNDITKYEINRFTRTNKGFTHVLCDLDFFKNINDQYGHDGGDFALKVISQILQNNMRGADTTARWGGEEFVMLFPETDMDQALVVLERIRKEIENHLFEFNGFTFHITMSFGACYSNHPQMDMQSIIKRADENLFDAKNTGRNRIVISEIFSSL
jgi:diguanylate cyclase (GGDEF)-like protein